ncbi:CHRD domain-containing protein [uncultured Paraglaciecola sp.]|uniref:CHRD domain-containing protein n=1 Tax=uncultured Paraglaciecola sp. TaxID=1765024 RepID=UPI0026252347|nr:CHRD domain-containing protein [uncultured Paraglaciecola sp.]
MNNIKLASKVSVGFALCALAAPFNLLAGHTNTVLEAELRGKNEVPSMADGRKSKRNKHVGDKNGKGEGYVFGIDGDPETLCYLLEVEKIQLVPVGEGMAAHIHRGPAGENGPVVAVLAGPEDGNAADCISELEAGKFPDLYPGIVQEILNHPEEFYINVHNPEFPSGAIRGQLEYQLEEDDDHSHD